MKIFKFGGASVSTAERVRKVAAILQKHLSEKLLVVISAMGKTTNALETVTQKFFSGDQPGALSAFEKIRKEHNEFAAELGIDQGFLSDFYTEVEWLLHDKPVRSY